MSGGASSNNHVVWCCSCVGNDAPCMYRNQKMHTASLSFFFGAGSILFLVDLVHDVDIQYLDAQQLIMNLYSNYVPLPTKKSIKKGTIEGSS
mmetsp:Transcript_2035/g.4692  ORF Transcript_2035/g.4692 Transcript_2035/m.4692 type:complete len:92 (-) Transcript_2035:54-329(-)